MIVFYSKTKNCCQFIQFKIQICSTLEMDDYLLQSLLNKIQWCPYGYAIDIGTISCNIHATIYKTNQNGQSHCQVSAILGSNMEISLTSEINLRNQEQY